MARFCCIGLKPSTRIRERRLTVTHAAELLHLSRSQVHRLFQAYDRDGASGLVSGEHQIAEIVGMTPVSWPAALFVYIDDATCCICALPLRRTPSTTSTRPRRISRNGAKPNRLLQRQVWRVPHHASVGEGSHLRVRSRQIGKAPFALQPYQATKNAVRA